MKQTPKYPEVAARMKTLRLAFSDLNQEEFAAKYGFGHKQWASWEVGANRPRIEDAERLCLAYGVTLDWIYLGRRDCLSASAAKVL